MTNRELVDALAAMTPDQVNTLVEAANATRSATALLEGLAPAKGKRKKRGPNKTRVVGIVPAPEVEEAPVARRRAKKDPKPLASALERLKAQKTPGLKARAQRPQDDED